MLSLFTIYAAYDSITTLFSPSNASLKACCFFFTFSETILGANQLTKGPKTYSQPHTLH
jgi:hypothetical protein